MNKFDPTKLRTQGYNSSEGWLVQVYGSDRRLLCVLESSHAWTFLLGCGFGLLVGLGWFTLARYTPAPTNEATTTPSVVWID